MILIGQTVISIVYLDLVMTFNRLNRVEAFLGDRHDVVKVMCDNLRSIFGVSETTVLNTIRRRLLIEQGEGECMVLDSHWLYTGIMTVCAASYLLFRSLYSLIFPRKVNAVHVDLLLENWGADNFPHYAEILERLSLKRVAVLSRVKEPLNFPPHIQVAYRPTGQKLTRHQAKLLIKALVRLFFFIRSRQVHIAWLYIVMAKKISEYSSEISDMSAGILLSSGDNYYGPVRYEIYKKYIRTIALMQNGIRGSFGSDSFICADYYFSFGHDIWKNIYGLSCDNIVPIGSVKSFSVPRRRLADNLHLDIVFIEQIVKEDVLDSCWRWAYREVMANLVRFAVEHSDLKVCIAMRPWRNSVVAEENDAWLRGTSILTSTALRLNSYEALQQAKLVITYNSSMGFEAAALGIPFLFCNYDHLPFLPEDDGLGVLCERGYDAFRRRVSKLLNDDCQKSAYTEEFCFRYMARVDDPIAMVVETLEPLLQQKNGISSR